MKDRRLLLMMNYWLIELKKIRIGLKKIRNEDDICLLLERIYKQGFNDGYDEGKEDVIFEIKRKLDEV